MRLTKGINVKDMDKAIQATKITEEVTGDTVANETFAIKDSVGKNV